MSGGTVSSNSLVAFNYDLPHSSLPPPPLLLTPTLWVATSKCSTYFPGCSGTSPIG